MSTYDIPIDRLIHFRRKVLHRYPELSGSETETAHQIAAFLSACNPDEIIRGIGGTGVAAIYRGQDDGPVVMLRCELDALPIQEPDHIPHRSENSGVSHKCGHDGHMAILCGVAVLLSHQPPKRGKVVLLFQPSEENGKGAASVLHDPKFEAIKPDWIFALHNLPTFPKNQIIVKNGQFTPAVNSIIVKYTGYTAHAATPDKGVNPARALAELTIELLDWNTDSNLNDFLIVTPVYQKLGEKAYGTSAGEGEAHFTLRCRDTEQMRAIEKRIESRAKAIADRHQLMIETDWIEEFYSGFNNEQAVDYIRKAASKTGAKLREVDQPFRWGEDFGIFTHAFKGAMFCVGAGEDHPALHHPDYDFPDEIIETAVKVFYETINEVLNV